MSRFLLTVAAGLCGLTLVTTAASARPGHGGSSGHGGHGGHGGGMHGRPSHSRPGRYQGGTGRMSRPRNSLGKMYRGRRFQHNVLSGRFRGFSKRCWFGRGNCWLYWCPGQCCWCSYNADDDCFLPCDDMTSEDIDDGDGDGDE